MKRYSVFLLLTAELRAALRERNIVVNTLLMPVLLYPALLWVMFNGIMFIQGQNESLVSRVHIVDLPAAHSDFATELRETEGIQVLTELGSDVEKALVAGEIDVVATFRSVPTTLASNFTVTDRRDARRQKR